MKYKKYLPIEITADIRSHPAYIFFVANLGLCVAVRIISSPASKTCFVLQNGIPSSESFEPASKAVKANENPLIASGIRFICSSRFKHLSIKGVACDGTANIIHLKIKLI